MANRMMIAAAAGARQFPDAVQIPPGDESLNFQHNVQKVFILGHELGHFFLERKDLAEQGRREHIVHLRLENAIQFLIKNSDTKQDPSMYESWRLIGSNQKFRDELFCDTIGVEMVEAMILPHLTSGSSVGAMAFEAIYFTAVGLDVLRAFRLAATSGENLVKDALDGMRGRDYIRGVCLNLLAQNRFSATKDQVDRMKARLQNAIGGEYGLVHVLGVAEQYHADPAGQPGIDDTLKAKLEGMYRWKSDPCAFKQQQIY